MNLKYQYCIAQSPTQVEWITELLLNNFSNPTQFPMVKAAHSTLILEQLARYDKYGLIPYGSELI